jgi:hypothetical protein
MSATYHIRIKKEYASSLIEDLQKADAIEVLEHTMDDNIEIEDWQKQLVLGRLKHAEEHPEKLVAWDIARERFAKSER